MAETLHTAAGRANAPLQRQESPAAAAVRRHAPRPITRSGSRATRSSIDALRSEIGADLHHLRHRPSWPRALTMARARWVLPARRVPLPTTRLRLPAPCRRCSAGVAMPPAARVGTGSFPRWLPSGHELEGRAQPLRLVASSSGAAVVIIGAAIEAPKMPDRLDDVAGPSSPLVRKSARPPRSDQCLAESRHPHTNGTESLACRCELSRRGSGPHSRR